MYTSYTFAYANTCIYTQQQSLLLETMRLGKKGVDTFFVLCFVFKQEVSHSTCHITYSKIMFQPRKTREGK